MFISFLTRKSCLFRTEPTKLNDPASENPSSSSHSIILSNSANSPNDGGESSWIESDEMDTDFSEMKDSKKISKKKEESEHVETIHPDIHSHSNAHVSNKDEKKSKRLPLTDSKSKKQNMWDNFKILCSYCTQRQASWSKIPRS